MEHFVILMKKWNINNVFFMQGSTLRELKQKQNNGQQQKEFLIT